MITWQRARPWALGAFLAVVAAALAVAARGVPWPQVGQVLRGYDAATLLLAAGLAAGSHLLYSTFDLLAVRHAGRRLATARVMAIGFVSYAFNLNCGALVGAAGLRYRLYGVAGLDAATIGRVLLFSVLTNWSGYAVLAGGLLAAGVVPVPDRWWIGAPALRAVGAGMMAAAAGYVALCAAPATRRRRLPGAGLRLPSAQTALVQVGASMLNWLMIGAIVHTLLPTPAPLGEVLGVHLISAVAAVLVHVPAGLGAIEATYVLLLGDTVDTAELIGALLAFRAAYYLGPLGVAIATYLVLESRAGGRRTDAGPTTDASRPASFP